MLLGPHSGSRPKTPQCDILSVGTHLPWMLGSDSPNGWDQLPTFYEPRTAEIGDVSETNSGGSSSKKWCLKLQHTKNGGFCKNGFSHTPMTGCQGPLVLGIPVDPMCGAWQFRKSLIIEVSSWENHL